MDYHHGKFVWFEHLSRDLPKARAFYEHYGFQPSPVHALTLMLRLSIAGLGTMTR